MGLNQELFRFSKGDPITLRIVEMTFSKIYFSTLESCSKFVNKDLRQLRSVYATYVLRQDRREGFLTMEKLMDILYSRLDSLMEHKEDNSVLFNLIYRLLLVPFYFNSLEVKEVFQHVVSIQYTCLYADYFFKFYDPELQVEIDQQIKQHEEAINGKMTEFCKCVIFTYMILFDD